MSKKYPTVDELVSTLKNSSLPTIVVEGVDDIIVYRRLEDALADKDVSVLAVGGRAAVLQIFERLGEISNRKNFFFIADKDLWVYSDVPDKYKNKQIIFTNGYSVENDIYRDGNLEDLLVPREKTNFEIEIKKFVYWYSLVLNRILKGVEGSINIYPGIVLDDMAAYADMTKLVEKEIYPENLNESLLSDYAKLIRGKSLMAILGRQISCVTRKPRIHHEALLEMHSARRGPFLEEIYRSAISFFNADENNFN